MDTLIRMPYAVSPEDVKSIIDRGGTLEEASYLPSIRTYFREFNRVLKDNGKACIHVPYSDLPLAVKFGFADISSDELKYICGCFQHRWTYPDINTCKHGALIRVITKDL